MDKAFFLKASVSNRTVQVTDLDAVIPAVSSTGVPEIRVRLPTRRLKTIEERQDAIQARYDEIEELEESIERERKDLLELVKAFRESGSGGSEVVVKNIKISDLMVKRSKLARPLRWIEGIEGLTFKDIFESKRDVRKIKSPVFQVKRRVEPIESLYVDLGREAAEATVAGQEASDKVKRTVPLVPSVSDVLTSVTDAAATVAAATKAATGAIIGQQVKKKVYKMKNPV